MLREPDLLCAAHLRPGSLCEARQRAGDRRAVLPGAVLQRAGMCPRPLRTGACRDSCSGGDGVRCLLRETSLATRVSSASTTPASTRSLLLRAHLDGSGRAHTLQASQPAEGVTRSQPTPRNGRSAGVLARPSAGQDAGAPTTPRSWLLASDVGCVPRRARTPALRPLRGVGSRRVTSVCVPGGRGRPRSDHSSELVAGE